MEEKIKIGECQCCGKEMYKGDWVYGFDGVPIACSLECFMSMARA